MASSIARPKNGLTIRKQGNMYCLEYTGSRPMNKAILLYAAPSKKEVERQLQIASSSINDELRKFSLI